MRVFYCFKKVGVDVRSFAKPAISILEQVDLLKSRGLYIRDEARAADFLSAVSFFRLTPYMRPFQVVSYADHAFLPGTRFRQISQLYEFDRRLRLLLMDAIERTEVAIRSAISNYMGPAYGPHWYLNRSHFKDRYDHERLISTIENAQQKALQDYRREVARIDRLTNADALRKEALKNRRAHESYARHYALTYDSPELMPGWAMLEELTIGDLSHLYRGLAKDNDRKFIGQQLAAPSPLLDSWLHTLTVVRNICAHHARIWNRELAIKPVRPKQAGFSWPDYLRGENQHTRVAMVLAILQHFMRQVSPHTQWCKCLADLFNEYIEIDLQAMGIQDTWYSDPFWQNDLMTANEI